MIPPGVYWNAEASNFYRMSDCIGMGHAFYERWFDWRNEFPQSSTNELPGTH